MSMHNPHREYLRHTVSVPLEVKLVDAARAESNGLNISHGGLAFYAEECLPIDHIVELRISTVDPPFEAQAKVRWCKRENGRYVVGAQFLNANDAFQSRMVQQVCAIEEYRQDVERNEGRVLNTQQAAAEWISKYAGRFPDGSGAIR